MWRASANVLGRRSANERWNWIFDFSERQTNIRSWADPRDVWPIKPKAFATPDLPRERDPVVVFKLYFEKRPESVFKPNAPFYLGVNHTTKNTHKSWFKANAMGVNKLNSLMKTMAEKAGLDSSLLRTTVPKNELFKYWMIRIFLLVI